MNKRYLIIDAETSGTKTQRRFCNPLNPEHQVDLLGYKYQGGDYKYNLLDKIISNVTEFPDLTDVNVIVGHNLKFDLLWYWNNTYLQEWLSNGGKVWDTMTVQYLLDAQQKIPRGLDALAVQCGGTLKDSSMKEYYKAGGQSKDVPIDTLLDYNKEDIENTNRILQNQLKLAKQKKMLPLIEIYMEHYLAIIEMEYNGFHINKITLEARINELRTEERYKVGMLVSFAKQHGYENFNPLSLDDLSLFLFGGELKARKKMPQFDANGIPIIVKKTGLQKEKFEFYIEIQKGIIKPLPWLRKNKKGHYFLTNDELLIASEDIKDPIFKEFIENILDYRKLTKKLSTYYEGLSECWSLYTGCVHPEFKTAYTDTGRLSSTNPNAQNLLPEVLHYIDSRYGEEGVLCELDFSQLEIRLQAYLTDSFEMNEDIQNGVDFHILRLSYAENLSYDETYKKVKESHEWQLKRKKAKAVSFAKAYGASPEKIAESAELDVQTVKAILEQEDLRYPDVRNFYTALGQELTQNRTVTEKAQLIRDKHTGLTITMEGEQQAYSIYKSLTQKEYMFYENAVLTRNGQVFRYFRAPKYQNSPIQGLAADFVSCQVGQFYRWLKRSGLKCWIIDEVHDSIILDCHRKYLTKVLESAKLILENTEKFEKITNKQFQISMSIDTKVGNTWGQIKEDD